MATVSLVGATEVERVLPDLTGVTQACVQDGANVGFVDPNDRAAIERFWQSQLSGLQDGDAELFVARLDNHIVACVMLKSSPMPNGQHRGDVAKLLVHPKARRQGIARKLMLQLEQRAREIHKTLLVLDTRTGDPATDLYLSMGWQRVGEIPNFAMSVDGKLEPTTYMYKALT